MRGSIVRRVFAIAGACVAFAPETLAQDVRNWDRQVERGREMQFQWLSFDEATCRDNGHPRFALTKPPRLGRFRAEKRTVTPADGACAGRRLSVLFVYYRAGVSPGLDETSYTIVGRTPITVNLRFTVF